MGRRAEAGWHRGPRGLNRLPLDLYFLLAGCAVIPLMLLLLELLSAMNGSDFLALYCAAAIADAVVISLVILGFLMALAAQVKLPDRAWLRRTLVGRLCAKLMQGVRVCLRGLRALMRMMPVMWQWFLTAVMLFFAMAFFWWVGGIGYGPSNPVAFFLFMVSGAAFAGAAGWGGYALGVLLTGAKKMSQGELSYQIPTRYLRGPFLDFACQLNALSGTAMVAAQKQTQAERMKTELITNVSHDIKTPLTSIINFVDLLQKPHTPEQEAEYLEVLARQSAHMKRLIEDLIELSKAATGSITAVPTRLDAAEAVNQALGEYADKLAAAELIPVFRQPEEPVYITADGRLVWRVLNNLFSNAVKYALPGTRLYVELSRQESRAILSLKNISRQELTVTAQELMERFVQGDASRTSGGSGLGLNIAQSLMEVQHGSLELTVDGDLFKVTLTFPSA